MFLIPAMGTPFPLPEIVSRHGNPVAKNCWHLAVVDPATEICAVVAARKGALEIQDVITIITSKRHPETRQPFLQGRKVNLIPFRVRRPGDRDCVIPPRQSFTGILQHWLALK